MEESSPLKQSQLGLGSHRLMSPCMGENATHWRTEIAPFGWIRHQSSQFAETSCCATATLVVRAWQAGRLQGETCHWTVSGNQVGSGCTLQAWSCNGMNCTPFLALGVIPNCRQAWNGGLNGCIGWLAAACMANCQQLPFRRGISALSGHQHKPHVVLDLASM